jgi:hypothetical protein
MADFMIQCLLNNGKINKESVVVKAIERWGSIMAGQL